MADDLKTNNERHGVEILIEPEIKGKWLSKIITWNKLFTISHLRTKLFLKITIRGQNIPSSLKLSGLQLRDGKGYYFELGKQFDLQGLRSNKVIKTESFKIVFPYSGQFWLDMNIKTESTDLILITKQKTLEGLEGRGTIRNSIGKEKPETGYSCRMPIGAIDILTVWLVFLTIGLLALTATLIFFKN